MPIAPQFNDLFVSCREMALSHLRPLMDTMFENSDIALLDFAEKAESNTAQSLFFDAMTEVRNKRRAIEQKFLVEVGRSFLLFPQPPENVARTAPPTGSAPALSLVDTNTMDTSVAMQNAVGKLSSRITNNIFGLKRRLAVVNGGSPIAESEIPAGPAWLGAAYRSAIEPLDMENKVRLVFIALFDKYVLANSEALYDVFNERLLQAGILTHLRYEVRKDPAGATPPRAGVSGANTGMPDASAMNAIGKQAAPPQADGQLGDELFGRILTLMSLRGVAGHDTAVPVQHSDHTHNADVKLTTEGCSATSSGPRAQLVQQLSRIQAIHQTTSPASSNCEFIQNLEVDGEFVEKLQATLADERQRIFGGVDRRKLPSADTRVIELVGMLFEFMLKDEHLPNLVKALLSRLHTPLLKVSVLDQTFFTRTQHPARKLLNDMTAAGIRWVDESHVDRGIFPKMSETVDRVLLEFEEDTRIFEIFVEDFSSHVRDLERRAQIVERRNAEAADGQEKLETARGRAQDEIRRLTARLPENSAAAEFLERIWMDKLTFILLRDPDGERSADWNLATDLARRIADSVVPLLSTEGTDVRRSSILGLQQELKNQVGTMVQSDKTKLLAKLFDSQEQALKQQAATVPHPPSQAAAETLRGAPGDRTPAPTKPQSVLTPAQEKAAAELTRVPFGTWFEFVSRKKGETVRAKLSWRSTITEKFMFVDQMGVRSAMFSLKELADAMIAGQVRIVTRDRKPFVDRALDAIYRMLDHSNPQKANA
jgi:hypothetical protein